MASRPRAGDVPEGRLLPGAPNRPLSLRGGCSASGLQPPPRREQGLRVAPETRAPPLTRSPTRTGMWERWWRAGLPVRGCGCGCRCACVSLSVDGVLRDLHKFILLVGSPVGTQTRLQGLTGGRAAPFPGLYSSIFWGGSVHHRGTKESRAPCVAGLWIILPLPRLPFPGEPVVGGGYLSRGQER